MAPAGTGSLGSRWVRIEARDGHEMHYRVSLGQDPGSIPVVLIHGMVAGLYLVPVGEYLAPHVRVYAPDLPGFGDSWRPEKPLDVAGLAETISDWLDAIGLNRVHLVGNSLGCNTAVEVAITRPDLAESLVLQGLTLAPELRNPVKTLPLWLINSWREVPRRPLMHQAQREVGMAALMKGAMNLISTALKNACQRSAVLHWSFAAPGIRCFRRSGPRRRFGCFHTGACATSPVAPTRSTSLTRLLLRASFCLSSAPTVKPKAKKLEAKWGARGTMPAQRPEQAIQKEHRHETVCAAVHRRLRLRIVDAAGHPRIS